jgi:hypothetical protein
MFWFGWNLIRQNLISTNVEVGGKELKNRVMFDRP